jgi:Na+-translocating ferredoxin:NAD+ oxidoreductase RnfC subunit
MSEDPNKTQQPETKTYSEDYVKGLREEAKVNRVTAEQLKAEKEELAKKIADAEKAELEKKGELQQLLDKERKEREDERKQLNEKMTAADRRFILAEAKAAAIKAGIVDPSDVKNGIDVSDLRIDDDGNVPGLEDKIAKLKESKPHWFKGDKKDDEDKRRRNLLPPERKDGNVDPNQGRDWNKASNDEMREKLKEYGVSGY